MSTDNPQAFPVERALEIQMAYESQPVKYSNRVTEETLKQQREKHLPAARAQEEAK